jgi:predicted nucleotidyltransferase component of viral defense system
VSRALGGLVQSVQTRLLSHARSIGADPNSVLARYGLERFLHRLALSTHAHRFVLKGGMLLRVWLGETSRPTRDADLLGYGDLSTAELARIFREICSVPVEPDGVSYAPDSVRVAPIRVEDAYGGQRVRLRGLLGKAQLGVQVDVGVGDVVTPKPEWIDYPSLLDLPRPRLRAYRPETTIAEKVHAMVSLGMANSRMRDFYDIYELARQHEFDGAPLASAIRDTFARRRTPLGSDLPQALTPIFGADTDKQAQWRAFLRKNKLVDVPQELLTTTEAIAGFVGPVLAALRTGRILPGRWPPGGGWRPSDLEAEAKAR